MVGDQSIFRAALFFVGIPGRNCSAVRHRTKVISSNDRLTGGSVLWPVMGRPLARPFRPAGYMGSDGRRVAVVSPLADGCQSRFLERGFNGPRRRVDY